MRGFRILLIAVLVSIGIGIGIESSSVSMSPSSTVHAALVSLGAAPAVEMSFSVGAPVRAGAVREELDSFVLRVDAASTDGTTPLSQVTKSHVGVELSVFDEGSDLADVRIVPPERVFIRVFLTPIAKLPSVPTKTRRQLLAAAPLIDGQWFSIPEKALGSLGKTVGGGSPLRSELPVSAKTTAAVERFEQDVLGIVHVASSAGPAGTQVTTASAPVKALYDAGVRDFAPILPSGLGRAGAALKAARQALRIRGEVDGAVTTAAGNEMVAGSVAVTVRAKRVTVRATVLHDAISLGVPADARPLPESILGALGRTVGPV